jgi:hypothetical protein
MGDLDVAGPIYAGRIGLRALWTEWSVEVRVLSGASKKAPHANGLQLRSRRAATQQKGRRHLDSAWEVLVYRELSDVGLRCVAAQRPHGGTDPLLGEAVELLPRLPKVDHAPATLDRA